MLTRNVLHRDISLGNLMIYKLANPQLVNDGEGEGKAEIMPLSGVKKGLLIDIDYSIELPRGPGARQTAIGHRTVSIHI